MQETPQQKTEVIKSQAADWLLLMETGQLEPDQEEAFIQWLNEDTLHQDIFAEVEQTWEVMGELTSIEEKSDSKVVSLNEHESKKQTNFSRNKYLPWGIAASLFLAFIFFTDLELWLNADYQTAIGEQQIVMLEDGSQVIINTNSAIKIDYSAQYRRLELLTGEAYFKVSPDAKRPFIVTAGEIETTALGTAFIIKLFADAPAQVTVTEHKVKVAHQVSGQDAAVKTLTEGQSVDFETQFSEVRNVDLTIATAWQENRLIFKNETLNDVIQELNRYYSGKIVVRDEKLGHLRVTGIFSVQDPSQALQKLQQSLPIKLTEITPYFIIISEK